MNRTDAADVRCLLKALGWGTPPTGDPLKAAQRLARQAKAASAAPDAIPMPDVWPPPLCASPAPTDGEKPSSYSAGYEDSY
jgi:hypothetical protein